MSGIPEARQLGEMLGATTTPTTGEEHRQLQRSLLEKMLDKAASDPTWKQRLLDDPKAAMQEADFPETQQLEELRQTQGVAEVRGHGGVPNIRGEVTEVYQCYGYCWWMGYMYLST